MNSSQQNHSSSGLSIFTPKHITHDEYWLLPGISSAYFCFACAVESLDDKSTLDMHRKKILAEMLEVFLSNNNIWKVLCSKRNVFIHVLNLYVKLLSQCKDDDYSLVIIECCLLTMKKTNIEQSSTIVAESTTGINQFVNNLYLLQLLHKVFDLAPSAVLILCSNQAKFMTEIVKASIANKNNHLLLTWKLINQAIKTPDFMLPRALYQEILVSANQILKDSSIVPLQIEVLKCIKSFAEISYLKSILLDHESSKLTTSIQSTFESIKKYLLSSNEDVQYMSIECISTIADSSMTDNQNLTTIVDIVLEKGICEFLLEVLPSSNERIMSMLFQCLQKLTSSKLFTKMGHMVYIFEATTKAVAKASIYQDTSSFYHGLLLLKILLQKGMDEQCNQSAEQSVEILKILHDGFQKSDRNIKYLTVSCFNIFLSHNTLTSTLFVLIDEFIAAIFNYTEKEFVHIASSNIDSFTEEFICNSYEAIFLIAKKLSQISIDSNLSGGKINSSDPNQLKEEILNDQLLKMIENLHYLCDRDCIPQAVLNVLPAKNNRIQCSFFKMLLAVIELVPSVGKKISLKLAESAFFFLIHEFKVISNRTSQNMDEVLAKLLYHLCLSVETSSLSNSLQDELYSSLLNFNIPMNDWKWLLNQPLSTTKTIDKEFLNKSRTCVLTLLTYSHKAGHCLIPLHAVMQELQKFALSESALSSLPTLGKRYFIYLWCHAKTNLSNVTNDLAHQNVISMFNSEAQRISEIIMISDMFLIWVLRSNFPLKIQQITLEEYFTSRDNVDLDRYSKLLSNLQNEAQNINFLEVSLNIASICKKQDVLNEIFFIGQSIIQSLEPDCYDHFKNVIRKIFLTGENEISGQNLTILIKFLNQFAIISPSIVNHNDLKLLCRVLMLATEIQTPQMQLEVLNYIYIIATKSLKSQNAKVISIIMEKIDIFTQFEKSLFTNEKVIQNSQSSDILERVNAAVLLLVSELMFSSKTFAIRHPVVLKFQKDVFIEILVCLSLPLMQVAILMFWTRYFQLKCASPLLQVIDANKEKCSIMMPDIKLLLIALQNLFYNEEVIIRENAVLCLVSLIDNLQNVDMFLNQPWNNTLQKAALEKLTYERMDNATVQLLTLFVKHSVQLDTMVFNTSANLLKLFSVEVNDLAVITKFVSLFDTIVACHVSDIKYIQLKEIKDGLKKLEKQLANCKLDSDQSKTKYVSLNGLMFLKEIELFDGNVFTQIKKIKINIEKQLEVLDSDATDSEDETEE